MTISFKKTTQFLLILIFILMSTLTVNAAYQRSIFPTLSSWAQALVSNIPEYSEQNCGEGITCLPPNEFENALTSFIIRFQVRNNFKHMWVGEDVLDAHLFESTQYLDLEKSNHRVIGSDIYSAFVQKMVIPSGSEVCFIGDLHGSAHSLIRHLLRLAAKGWLNNDFSLRDKNHYIIFTGDIVDRGGSGVEALYTILRLKYMNWDNVIILRGNHESAQLSHHSGFFHEVRKKYKQRYNSIWFNRITRFYELLPFALYLGCGQGENQHFALCCHGGIEPGFDPKELLHDRSSNKFQLISSQHIISCVENEIAKRDNYSGFNWSDFCQENGGKIICNHTRGAGYIADIQATKEFLRQQNIKAFFRGHQDMAFGIKMFFNSAQDRDQKINELQEQGKSFQTCLNLDIEDEAPQGPYHWQYVVHPDHHETIPIGSYPPIYTLSTATEGRGLQFDCFGIVKTANIYENWTLQPHEYNLETVSSFNRVPRSSIDGSLNEDGDLQPFYSHLSLLEEKHDIVMQFCSEKDQAGLSKEIIECLSKDIDAQQKEHDKKFENQAQKRKADVLLENNNSPEHTHHQEKKVKLDE